MAGTQTICMFAVAAVATLTVGRLAALARPDRGTVMATERSLSSGVNR